MNHESRINFYVLTPTMALGFFKREIPIGLDISDRSIEVLQLGTKREVLAYGRIVLEEGIVRDGRILGKEKLAAKLEEVLRSTKPISLYPKRFHLDVVLSLPAARTFIHLFTIRSNVTGEEIKSAVLEHFRNTIPLDPEQAHWDFQVGNPNAPSPHRRKESLRGEQLVLYAGTPKEVINEYLDVLSGIPLTPIVFDIEIASLGRAFVKQGIGPTMIVDIGAGITTVGIFGRDGTLDLSISIPVAGNHFTKAIMDELQISEEEAERAKRVFGLDSSKADNIIFSILQPSVDRIIKELAGAIVHYQRTRHEEVQEIILTGGSALLPMLAEHIGGNLARRAAIGNPFGQIKGGELFGRKFPPTLFANVIGLSMRGSGDVSYGINFLKSVERPLIGGPRQIEAARLLIKKFFDRLRKSLLFGISIAAIGLLFLGFAMYAFVFRAPIE